MSKLSRTLSLVSCALLTYGASFARGASVTIEVALASTTPGANGLYPYALTLDVADGVRVGAVSLVVAGFSGRSLNPANLGISPPDSPFVHPFGDDRASLIIANTENGVAIAAGPTTGALLATLYSPYLYQLGGPPIPVALLDNPHYFGGTAFNDFLAPISDVVVLQIVGGFDPPPDWVNPTFGAPPPPPPPPGGGLPPGGPPPGGPPGGAFPEPSSFALACVLAAGLFGLVCARDLSVRRLRE